MPQVYRRPSDPTQHAHHVHASIPPPPAPTTVGTWTGPGWALPDVPVAGSVLRWTADVPSGASVTVRTSLDNGFTWQAATNGGPIPGLANTSRHVRAVLYQAVFARPTTSSPKPVLQTLTAWIAVVTNRVEWIPLGAYTPVNTVVRDEGAGVIVELDCDDISSLVSDAGWESIKTWPAGTNLGDVVAQIIRDRYPSAVLDFTATTATALATLTVGGSGSGDPMADACRVAQKAGLRLFVDYRGIFCMRPPPDPELDQPVLTLSDRQQPVLTSVTRTLTKTGSANYVVVEGESVNGSTPARAVVVNDLPGDPNSVAAAGQKTLKVVSKLIADNAQALTTAQALAVERKGAQETDDLSMVPYLALTEGDTVELDRSVSGLTGRALITGMDITAGSAMSLSARRRKLDETSSGGNVGGLDGDTGTPSGGGTSSARTYTTPGECHKIGTNGSLNFFKLQTAFSGDSSITEKSVAQIGAGYAKSPEYCMNTAKTAVQMRVNLNAPTTSGSSNPRTEYREMQSNGTSDASWTATSGQHWTQCTVKPTHLAAVNKSCSFMQVHDSSDDVVQILTRKIGGVVKLCVRLNGTDNDAWVLDGSFDSLPEFTCRLEINAGVGKFWYHRGTDPTFTGSPTLQTGSGGLPSLSFSGGCYFKVGTYSQSTGSESSSDYAAAEYRKLGLYHPGYATPVFDSDTVGGGDSGSFTVGFGACINASDASILGTVATLGLDWWFMLGDTWYKDGSTPNWVSDWTAKFGASNYASLLNSLTNPQIVGWSDHDFGYNNNSTGSDDSSLTANANNAYRSKFGTSPGGIALPSNGIYRTGKFTDRVRWILLDCMTSKSRLSATDNSSKTMLGSTQKAWYKNLLATASEPLIVVFGDGQIPGPAEAGQDEWRGYSTERAELATAVSNSPATVIYCNGDTHSLAYGHDQYGYARVWQSAPLHNTTKVKAAGQGYIATWPTNANEDASNAHEHVAVMTFTDDGSTITVTYRGYEGSALKLTDTISVT